MEVKGELSGVRFLSLHQCEAQVIRFSSKLLHPLNNLTGHLLQACTREKNLKAHTQKKKLPRKHPKVVDLNVHLLRKDIKLPE